VWALVDLGAKNESGQVTVSMGSLTISLALE
jgi:hypothetical protein